MNFDYLITGGAGHIGSSLIKSIAKKNKKASILVIDDLSTGNKENITGLENVELLEADINNINILNYFKEDFICKYIFHYAATVGVERTQKDPIRVLNDIEGMKNVIKIAKIANPERFFLASSSEVYGEPVEFPQNELTTPLNSRLPYAVVKNINELYLKSFSKKDNFSYSILRFFNTYGPCQSADFVIPRFIKMALNNNDISIYGDGSQTRTFLHIDDNVDFTELLIEKELLKNDTVNVGCDEEISILELAKTVIKLTKSKSKIIFQPPLKDGDMQRRQADNSKMLGLYKKELIPIDEGLRRLISFYKTL